MIEQESLFLYVLGASLAVILGLSFRRQKPFKEPEDFSEHRLMFLIQGSTLIDMNFAARGVLQRVGEFGAELDQLRLFLSQHFDQADNLCSPAEQIGDLLTSSRDGQLQAKRETSGSTVRLKVVVLSSGKPDAEDIHSLRAMESELETLRTNTAAAPFLLWRQNPDGDVTWVNKAYLDAAKDLAPSTGQDWPLPVLFPPLSKITFPVTSESRRMALQKDEDQAASWFDCHICAVGDDVLCTAIPADEAVRAENRRREFTQTLTKTFAELAIGLAIFDRSRRLVLFNPALLDLTSLATDFLTSRPSMVSFLDHLRENRVMPEPRDYRSWRTAIAELEAAAVDGTYSETWSLPDGQTYHVTGKPHPDGAVALLFEDISAEMSLTRHFRTELEQLQSVIDGFDDAVALFSAAGDMVVSNQSYRAFWGIKDDEFLIGDVAEATRKWHELSVPTPVWGDFRDFAQGNQDREAWNGTVALRDGRQLDCRFVPQKAGATLAIFRITSGEVISRLQEVG